MRTTAIDAMLTNVIMTIPTPVLQMAYRSDEYDTSIDQRIVEQLFNRSLYKDVSILCGKLKTIILETRNRRPTTDPVFGTLGGSGIESEFYEIPPQQRENRDLVFIIGPSQKLTQPSVGEGMSADAGGLYTGNTMMSNFQFMLNSRTLGRTGVSPTFEIAGSNTVCVTPRLMSYPFMLDVLLGYDKEYSNAEPSVIMALRELAVVAAKRDIYRRLVVPMDQGAVIAGAEIGTFRDVVTSYASIDEDTYNNALIKVQRAGMFDLQRIRKSIVWRI